jgi:malate dehydrogenase
LIVKARKKVSIIGAGKVGSTAAQILAYREICDIVLWNRTAETAQGIALDIEESAPLEEFDVSITGTGDFSAIEGSDVVAITAGAQRKEGMSREDLLKVNAGIVSGACQQIRKYAPDSTILVVSNPLDAMAYVAKKASGFPRERVLGMAGILDSSRFRTFIALELGVSVEDISALVLGGHGDFMVPLPRYSSVAGIPLTELLGRDGIYKIIKRTRNAGAEIISLEKESSAFYAPASSLVQMIEAVIRDKRMVLPCAAYLNGEYGIKGIFMGVPVILGSRGIDRIVELKLTKEEKREVEKSSVKIRELVCQIDKEVCG